MNKIDPGVDKPKRKGIQSILTGFRVIDYLVQAGQPVLQLVAVGAGMAQGWDTPDLALAWAAPLVVTALVGAAPLVSVTRRSPQVAGSPVTPRRFWSSRSGFSHTAKCTSPWVSKEVSISPSENVSRASAATTSRSSSSCLRQAVWWIC